MRGLVVLLALAGLTWTSAGFAQAPKAPADAAARCAALQTFSAEQKGDPAIRARLIQIPDAPTEIITAAIVPAHDNSPEICLVTGFVAPTVGFEVRMPTKDWNGKFMMQGCGAACGVFFSPQEEEGLTRNFATAATDLGHKGHPASWLFSYVNLESYIDFSFRATHVTTLAAKEIIDIFYNKAPRLSYFNGCSTGGNMALMEAERFPNDYDGIMAGDPPYGGNRPSIQAWSAGVNIGADGHPILYADKLELVSKAVLEACDTLDGLKDGVLQDPRQCHWDPAAITCKAGDKKTDSCLTTAEAEVVRKIYAGPEDSKGHSLGNGMQRGSEYNWVPNFIANKPKAGEETPDFKTAINSPPFPRPGLGAYYPAVPANATKPYDYDKDPQRGNVLGSVRAVGNPDLRDFKAHGGKLILYHGWDDNEISASDSADFYELTTRAMGGEAATREFFRFFAVPGMGHCRHGHGGGAIDWLPYLDAWVDGGHAPDSITVQRLIVDQNYLGVPRLKFPLDASLYDRSRPVYPYPDVAKWSGQGDANQAANWVKADRAAQ